ncbi:MAG: nucleotidyltransferase family protein [Lachnospiraceae bacterium]|nr:nucleotidyltransferase family protein [Lachnospiraceae bacterium]
MKVTAVISEYNPLHSGHARHLELARKETGADYIIAVMSGNYVQRGCPAIISKYTRAHTALLSGADLVIELPLCYSTGSIEFFSMGAVSLIRGTGIASCISFGSECGDIDLLKRAALLTAASGPEEDIKIRELLSSGMNYSSAVNSVCDLPDEISELLKSPNNLLAVSYIKAAWALGLECDFHTVRRIGASYHDDSEGALSSTAIRRSILAGGDNGDGSFCHLLGNKKVTKRTVPIVTSERMPAHAADLLNEYFENYPPLCEDDLSLLLFYRLLGLRREDLTAYLDVSDSLAAKIVKEYRHASSFSDLTGRLKTKDLNYARISRALLHILLDIRKDHMDEYRSDGYNYYIKPLAFKKTAGELMHSLKDRASIPIISKNADAPLSLQDRALLMFEEGIKADDLYEKTACTMCGRSFKSEYERSVIIL